LEVLPNIPTVANFVPGYEASSWYGIGVPRGTQAEIVDRLNREINAALANPKLKARLADLGGAVLAGSPVDFGKPSATRPRNGPRSFGRPTSRRNRPNARVKIFHNVPYREPTDR
jgi:hypothetical protein